MLAPHSIETPPSCFLFSRLVLSLHAVDSLPLLADASSPSFRNRNRALRQSPQTWKRSSPRMPRFVSSHHHILTELPDAISQLPVLTYVASSHLDLKAAMPNAMYCIVLTCHLDTSYQGRQHYLRLRTDPRQREGRTYRGKHHRQDTAMCVEHQGDLGRGWE